jgi:hypothetical protein
MPRPPLVRLFPGGNAMRVSLLVALVAASLGHGPPAAAEEEDLVSVGSLLVRMTDLRTLADPPVPGERTVQFSSYDRASRLVDGKIEAPFANGDRGHYLRVDTRPDGTKEHVLAEAEGPGYVSRIWSANPAGVLRVYVDGGPSPVIAGDFAAITRGAVAPLGPPFGQETSRGCTLYFPIPFAKSIRIVTTEGDQYYQVGLTYLPPGTPVQSLDAGVLRQLEATLPNIARALTNEVRFRRFLLDLPAIGEPVVIPPGETRTLDEGGNRGGGDRAISGIRMQVESPVREVALARSLLAITFDGAREPQVAVPVGDFFGSGPGVNPHRTAVTEVLPDGRMLAQWVMPFRRSHRIQLTNGSDQPLAVTTAVAYTESLPAGELLRFHARWRQEDDIATVAGDGTRDWHALGVKGGPGRFVGLQLNVHNPTAAWWGEGDEKVFVDGEPFPSTFGTGTEDYFGYAWCDPRPYDHPFHAQTRCDGPGNRGNTSNVRCQFLDAIPWQDAFRFDIEVWHWEAVKVQYATIAYFYAAPGVTIEPGVPDLSKRIVHSGEFPVHREPGVVEAEGLAVRRVTSGETSNQAMAGFGEQWSGASQLWWVCREPGGTMTVELPVATAGRYGIEAALTRAADYGIVQLALDGEPLGTPIDLYHDGVIHTGPIALGERALEAGPHELTLSITGQNPASSSYLVGLDWIRLRPIGK